MLEKAKKFVRQWDTQNDASLEAMMVVAIRHQEKYRKDCQPTLSQTNWHKRRYGKTSHLHQLCLASNANRFRCNRKGHFSSQCLSKTMRKLTTPLYQQSHSNMPGNDPYSEKKYLSVLMQFMSMLRITLILLNGISLLWLKHTLFCSKWMPEQKWRHCQRILTIFYNTQYHGSTNPYKYLRGANSLWRW